MTRKSISKKIRFEVFKRDSFTCQYCGSKSPEVTLEVDHIEPVSKGGDNNIMNLITSCFDCNRGKSDRTLEDNTVIEKQNEQLQSLNERKIQLEMMMEWRKELLNLDNELVDELADYFVSLFGGSITVNEQGLSKLKKWLKKYSFEILLESIESSTVQYYDDVDKSFNMIPKIAYYIAHPQEEHMKDLFYIRGIVKNRFDYYNPKKTIIMLRESYDAGIDLETLKRIALESKHWTAYREEMERIMEDY